jgi:hypothetical protein
MVIIGVAFGAVSPLIITNSIKEGIHHGNASNLIWPLGINI